MQQQQITCTRVFDGMECCAGVENISTGPECDECKEYDPDGGELVCEKDGSWWRVCGNTSYRLRISSLDVWELMEDFAATLATHPPFKQPYLEGNGENLIQYAANLFWEHWNLETNHRCWHDDDHSIEALQHDVIYENQIDKKIELGERVCWGPGGGDMPLVWHE